MMKSLSVQFSSETVLGMQGLSNLIIGKPMCYYDP